MEAMIGIVLALVIMFAFGFYLGWHAGRSTRERMT